MADSGWGTGTVPTITVGDWDTGDQIVAVNSWQDAIPGSAWIGYNDVLTDKTNRDLDSGADGKTAEANEPGLEASQHAVCRNCEQPGHVARECPEPKKVMGRCFNCGEFGHNKADCPNSKTEHVSTGACFNCGEIGHNKVDCPHPKPERALTGECFNCGEIGHNMADCPNPKVERPFTGECHYCKQEGHRAAECPNKPAEVCRNCRQEGHKASECTAPRVFEMADVPDLDKTAAWEMVKQASDEKEIEEFKTALKIYSKADPTMTFNDLELKLRGEKLNIYIVALDKEIPKTMTNVDLQGNTDCKYCIGYFFSSKPKRPFMVQWWPADPKENLERLKNAGDTMDSHIPVCRNCDEQGHMAKDCPEEKLPAIEPLTIKCSNCNEEGHRLRDCPKERVESTGGLCRNCNQPGHKAAECPEPRSAANVECRRCGEKGHFSKECPSNEGGGSRACHNCGEEGHMSRECDKPRDPAKAICRNCGDAGHYAKECPKPKDWTRVKCDNCGEMGHGIKKCPQPANDSSFNDDSFNSTNDGTADSGGVQFDNTTGDNDNAGNTDTWTSNDAWQPEQTYGTW